MHNQAPRQHKMSQVSQPPRQQAETIQMEIQDTWQYPQENPSQQQT